MIDFTHLHLHTPYSLLEGFSKIDETLDKCLEYGMDTVAITDIGAMFGVVEFFKKAKKKGIKPIIGCELYVTSGSYLEKSNKNPSFNLVLLVENDKGYQNLIKLVSKANLNGYYHKPRVDYDLLRKYSEGIIALSGSLDGEIQTNLRYDNYEEAIIVASKFKDIFGEDNFFLEIQDHGLPDEKKIKKYIKKISNDLGIPLVATNDVYYVEQEDSSIHDILLCVGSGSTISQKNRKRFPNSQYYLKSSEEMNKIFSDIPEALINTRVISERCNFTFEFNKMHLPYFSINKDHDIYLRELVYEGLINRYKEINKEIEERYNLELEIIKKMGYTDYFLIVWDFIDYAKKNNIPVGPGRGSAAGSIVSYSLGITDIDPLEYNLIFERFLNPHRVSMPDIDIDFCYDRREEVIEYVKNKYGNENVAQIATFGTMAARNAIRDVGRALEIDYTKVDKIAKKIPKELKMTIEKALKCSDDFRKSYNYSSEYKKLIDIAKAVEGNPRHISTHAAGVVIAARNVDNYVPLVKNGEQIATQFNMTEIEELGLLKMDFLGLRTLTVINDAIKLIKYNYGKDVDIDNIDVNDKNVLEIFTNAETIGIFQFESGGMRSFLRDLRPTRFDDLIAANSLFRPGPMNEIPNYIKNRHNPESITYLTPQLESILKTTYGIIVYQEQVMQIVQKLAGFSLGESDNLRRAMGKKKMKIMEENRDYFVNGKVENGKIILPGCVRNGINEQIANKIYDLMIDFAKYAFNKSHSAAYSLIAIRTAWLKKYYPHEFMAALLSSIMGDNDKIYLYIKEAKRLGLEILSPNINYSYKKFSVENSKIRIGLSTIKNLGHNLISSIIQERKNGEFKTYEEFIERISVNKDVNINKRAIEALILSGALDNLGYNRAQMINSYSDLIDSYKKNNKNNILGQEDIFSLMVGNEYKINIPYIKEFDDKQLLKYEKEYLGIYVSSHPYTNYEKSVKKLVNFTTLDLIEGNIINDKIVKLGGIITKIKIVGTKNNQNMAFITIEDVYGSIEAVVFPTVFEKNIDIIKENKAIFVTGKLKISDDKSPNVIINTINEIILKKNSQNDKRNDIIKNSEDLYLKMNYNDKDKYYKLKEIFDNNGDSKVFIYFEDINKLVKLKETNINLKDDNILRKIKNLLGADRVKIK